MSIFPDLSCRSLQPRSRRGLLCRRYLCVIQMCHPGSSLIDRVGFSFLFSSSKHQVIIT